MTCRVALAFVILVLIFCHNTGDVKFVVDWVAGGFDAVVCASDLTAAQIQEEKAKTAKINELSEPVGNVPKDAESSKNIPELDNERFKELERENLDLKIANRGKDFLIDQLKTERNGFFDQLLSASRKVGELETKLLQLESPDASVRNESR